MMIGEFADAKWAYCRRYHASETSGIRSDIHTVAVGGFVGDPHNIGVGADVVYDNPAGGSTPIPALPPELQKDADAYAAELGLFVWHEATHDHLQPRDITRGLSVTLGAPA